MDPAAASAIDVFDGVDIYLIDQVLKRRFVAPARVLDAGCGGGRNLNWFLRAGFDVYGIDMNAGAIEQVRSFAGGIAPQLPPGNFRVELVEQVSHAGHSFDIVLSIAVLHFARDEGQFNAMLKEMWRVLRPGGILFTRLGSTIGIEELVRPTGDGRFHVPDGSVRFLVDMERLLKMTRELGAELLEPIKTVNVQNMRCMTTWVLRKCQ